MFISWLGNSTFLIKTSLGKRILTDPINKFHSCNIDTLKPNLITLSSTTFKCNCLSNISPDITLITGRTIYSSSIGTIEGFKSFCDDSLGLKRGSNTIYKYEIDNITLCHLGYLGHLPDSTLLKKIKNCDILFLPIGGNITLDGKLAYELLKKINPTYVIPMNYKFNCDSFLFDSPNRFLKFNKRYYSTPKDNFFITMDSIKKEVSKNNIILLTPLNTNTI